MRQEPTCQWLSGAFNLALRYCEGIPRNHVTWIFNLVKHPLIDLLLHLLIRDVCSYGYVNIFFLEKGMQRVTRNTYDEVFGFQNTSDM